MGRAGVAPAASCQGFGSATRSSTTTTGFGSCLKLKVMTDDARYRPNTICTTNLALSTVRAEARASLVDRDRDHCGVRLGGVQPLHVGGPQPQTAALIEIALVGDLARVETRSLLEQHQSLDP